MRLLGTALALLLWLFPAAWGAAAFWIDGPGGPLARGLLAGAFGAGLLGLRFGLRPWRRGVVAAAALFLVVLGWWLSLAPSHERDWLPEVAELPRATLDGDLLTIENVRNFRYRSETDFDEVWETRSWDLSRLRGVDLFLVTWGAAGIAHTITSWEFEDAPPLSISIETRKERGEAYSAVLGFFRQFELYYVVGDERDLIGVRAGHLGEKVRLYHLKQPADDARRLLLDYLGAVNALADEADWYNAATHNCTTTIRRHMQHVGLARPFDWRIILNDSLDELGYEQGRIDTSLPFAELRAASDVTERARLADGQPDFSERIREGLPGGHPKAGDERGG
jgi:hypothetical protein